MKSLKRARIQINKYFHKISFAHFFFFFLCSCRHKHFSEKISINFGFHIFNQWTMTWHSAENTLKIRIRHYLGRCSWQNLNFWLFNVKKSSQKRGRKNWMIKASNYYLYWSQAGDGLTFLLRLICLPVKFRFPPIKVDWLPPRVSSAGNVRVVRLRILSSEKKSLFQQNQMNQTTFNLPVLLNPSGLNSSRSNVTFLNSNIKLLPKY